MKNNTTAMIDMTMIEEEVNLMTRERARGMITEEYWQSRMKEMEERKKELVKSVHKNMISAITTKESDRSERTRWSTRVTENGKRKWIRAGSEDELYKKLFDFYCLSQKPEPEPEPEAPTLANTFKAWTEYKEATVKYSTIQRYVATWNRYYKGDPITARSLADMRPDVPTIWLADQVRKRNMSSKEFQDMRGLWREIEDYLYVKSMIKDKIVHNMPRLSPNLFRDVPKRERSEAILLPDEIDALTAVAFDLYKRSHFNTSYLGLAMSCYLGLRAGELCCLRWDSVVNNGESITIKQSETPNQVKENGRIYTRGYRIVDHLKAHHDERTIPLPPEAKEILAMIKRENFKHGVAGSEYIFMQKKGERVHTRAFQKAIQKAYEKLGWEDIKIGGVHEFRRTYATTLIEDGAPPEIVKQYMGHRSFGTTSGYYLYSERTTDYYDGKAVSAAFEHMRQRKRGTTGYH